MITIKNFVITEIADVNKFVNLCSHCTGCVEVRRGRWCVDGSSIMGLMSLNLSEGVTITFNENDVSDEFLKFVETHSFVELT